MERFVIEGGKALAGTVRPSGSKNEALPTIAACLLTGEPVVLKNVPDIADVRVMFQVLEQLGAKVEHLAADTVRVRTSSTRSTPTSRGACAPPSCSPVPSSVAVVASYYRRPVVTSLGAVVSTRTSSGCRHSAPTST